MGLSGVSPLSLLLILAIIIALFGTAKIKTIWYCKNKNSRQ